MYIHRRSRFAACLLSILLTLGAGCLSTPPQYEEPLEPTGGSGGAGGTNGTGAGGRRGESVDGPAPTGGICSSVCEAEKSDGCCPAGCTAASDIDCVAQCGNGVLEKGEQCDPPASCPASCQNRGCTKFSLEGSAAECTAVCKEAGRETACKSDDGCCPTGCTVDDDTDCGIVCGNNTKEGNETCDPVSSCPTACAAQGCQLRRLINAGTCTAECVNDRLQTACMSGDGCCPPGCHAGNDPDCLAVCDNNVKESGETCEPLSSCPTACPAKECQLRKLIDAGTCKAQCIDDRLQITCQSDDDCCPTGCNSTNDTDCGVKCGNNVKEPGETCDPPSSCPDSCPAMGCQLRELKNPGTCKAVCENSRIQTACAPNDDCCPSACNANNDNDCEPKCGNGIIESGEKCEPVAECTRRQNVCKSDRDTVREGRGSTNNCSFECAESPRRCGDADGQCPSGCQNDPDCKRSDGSTCDNASQCLSNRCTDGRCCAQSCGACEKCTGGGGTCELPPGTRVCGNRCISTSQCCETCQGPCRICDPARNSCQPNEGVGCNIGGRPGTCNGSGTCVPNCVANQGQRCGPDCNRGTINCQGQCTGQSRADNFTSCPNGFCFNGSCVRCGNNNEECCTTDFPQLCVDRNDSICNQANRCVKCGKNGQECCAQSSRRPNGCDSGLTCDNNGTGLCIP